MTSGTRRGGTSRFSSSKLADSPLFAPYDETIAYGDVGPFGQEEPTVQLMQTVQAGYPDRAPETGSEDSEPELSRNGARYAGRHTTRKRVRRVVPVVAVAATLAAGAAAFYSLSGGVQPRPGNTNASMALHGTVASMPVSAVGEANGAASAPIKIATATASYTAHTSARHAVRATHRRRATAAQPAAASSPATPAAGKASAPAAAAPAATHAAAPASTPATHTMAATTQSCNTNAGLLPQNVSAIVSFLLAHGYSDNAAAGIAGNIYQESKGNPESVGSGGGGLIGWTPLPAGFITGSVAADLQTQLAQILTYNQIWAQFLPALNSAASPAAAADIYVTDFERAGIPAASTREASAQDVASACGI